MWPVLKQMPESRELCLLIYDEMQHICQVMYLVQFVPILEKIESVKKNADGIMGMIPSTNILAKLIGEVWASEITIKYVSLEVYSSNFDRTSLLSFDYFAKSIF